MSVVSRNPVVRCALLEAALRRAEDAEAVAGLYVEDLERQQGGPSPDLDAAYHEYNEACDATRRCRRALRKATA